MYVCDGSVIAANLGVNPSLTICALTERAMSYIPAAAENTWSDTAETYLGAPSATSVQAEQAAQIASR
jgi:cholesterol oxidase